MHAVEPLHSPTPEDIMEYMDGEGAPATRDRIAAHLVACATCQAVVASQRELSDRARAWTTTPAPPSFRLPATPATARVAPLAWLLRRPRFAVLTFSAAAAVMIAFVMTVPAVKRTARSVVVMPQTASSVPEYVQAPAAAPSVNVDAIASRGARAGGAVGGAVSGLAAAEAVPLSAAQLPRPSSVIRTATLRIIVKEFTGARQNVEIIVEDAQGFIDRLTVTGDTSSARELRGALRVPGDRLAAVLTRLRALGAVTEDTQGSEDVTDQVVDLDARLASARATEKRLTELLQHRTGRLSDVLDVERELARVRLDIERLDAEKTNIGRRVTYATIDIAISEERKAGLDPGPLSLATRIRLAALDGIENLVESVAGALLFVLRAGPALSFWVLLAAGGWLAWRRIHRTTPGRGSSA